MHKWLKRLAVLTSVGMFFVLLMGSLVTKTGSGRGCGEDWPLCNGKFIPAYTLESMIEYSHRFVTGIVGLFVFATFMLVLLKVKNKEAKLFAASIAFFTLVQAVMGALAVVWPQSSAILALHFGFSLLAFASTLLLLGAVWASPEGSVSANGGAAAGRFRLGVWFSTFYCYVVVYLGAFVRHTESAGGCGRDWPLCAGQLVPELSGATGIVFLHRLGAVLLLIVLLLLDRAARRTGQSSAVRRACRWSLYLVLLQVFSGALVTYALGTDWYLFPSLLHTVIISGLFGILCYLSVLVAPRKPAADAANGDSI